MEKTVSVIVPIYNVEKYLERSVRSILKQSYDNLEVILVDDGSPDKCGNICDDLAKEDKRIKVIHKENGGLSDARNAGLDIATGDYIVFVDSDDHISPDFIDILMKEMDENDADVAMCSYKETSADMEEASFFDIDKNVHAFDGEREVYETEDLLKNLYDANHVDATYFIVAWNKIYKACLWDGVRFPKGRIHEDEATTYLIYEKAKKGVYLRRPLYAYYKMDESITRGKFNLKRLNWFDALDERIEHFEEKGDEKQVSYALRARADGAIHYYYPLSEEMPAEREEKKRLKEYVRAVSKSEGGIKLSDRLFILSPSLYRILSCVDRDRFERAYQILFFVLMLWIAVLGMYKLDVKYVDPWDESRHGVNALEMLRYGNVIRSTYLGQTDYYNLKPPLSMWSLMISFLIFGKNVFALRFPSVCFYLVTAASAACFVRKKTGRIAALLTLILLAGNTTPFLAHMVRAGDADSLYVMIFALAMITMTKIRDDERNLSLCGLLFALGFLTKSFHAGLIAIIGIIYLLSTGLIVKISKKEWGRFFGFTLVPVVLWAGARFASDGPKFFKLMWETDVLGRSKSGFGSNEAGFSYYFSYFFGDMSGSVQIYFVALMILVAALIIIFTSGKEKMGADLKDRLIGLILWSVMPLLCFSLVSTKLLWYEYPAVTGLLVLTAFLTGEALKRREKAGRILAVACAVTGLVFSVRLFGIFNNLGVNGNALNDLQLLIKNIGEEHPEYNGYDMYVDFAYVTEEGNIAEEEWSQQDVFMAEAYCNAFCKNGGDAGAVSAAEDGTPVILFTNRSELIPHGDKVIADRGEYTAVCIE